MGVGDALGSIFGGGNDYKYQMPPTLGPPRQPGESAQDYSNRTNQVYQNQNQDYTSAINRSMGNTQIPNSNLLDYGAANQTLGQQSSLAQQLLAQGRGEGPNPALDQLHMTTDQNARQASAMAASQRGINPALAARMAGQNVASTNQQAAGQAGLQSAQQQLGAQQAAGGLLGNISQQQAAQANAQGQAGLNLMTANTNQEAIRRQSQLAYQKQIQDMYNSMNAVNAGVSSQNASTNLQYGMGAMSGLSSALQSGAMALNKGGEVTNPFMENVKRKHMADGGMANYMNYQQDPMAAFYGQLGLSGQIANKTGEGAAKSEKGISSGLSSILGKAFSGSPQMGDFGASSMGGMDSLAMASSGGKVNGKAKVKGDSETNDNVPAMLSPGEIVIPRSATSSAEDAHAFLDSIIRKHEGPDFKDVAKAKEKFHKMAHGGEMSSCGYCYGGMS